MKCGLVVHRAGILNYYYSQVVSVGLTIHYRQTSLLQQKQWMRCNLQETVVILQEGRKFGRLLVAFV